MQLPELLAPAGNLEKLETALHYGADAVYLGLSEFSLRAKAENFTPDGLKDAVAFARSLGKKSYVTVNIFPHNRDIGPIREHLLFLNEVSPDAVIVSDPGAFKLAAELIPDIALHVSTQANITNYRSAQFWETLGAKRLVLSRELTIDEIREIRQHVSLEIECFVHGALCISYSGRCYLSSFMANRSGNRGECTNACRWNYALVEEKRPGEYYPVYEDERGTYLLSSRDLCMIGHLDRLSDAGVQSFKIEGRMKGINYLAGIVKTYREAIDSLSHRPYRVEPRWLSELAMTSSRGYTTGMYLGSHPVAGYNHDDEAVYRMSHELVGVVRSVQDGRAVVSLRNSLRIGDSIQYLSRGIGDTVIPVTEMSDENGAVIESGRNEETVMLPAIPGVRAHDIIRRPHRP